MSFVSSRVAKVTGSALCVLTTGAVFGFVLAEIIEAKESLETIEYHLPRRRNPVFRKLEDLATITPFAAAFFGALIILIRSVKHRTG